jgi:hypothetical protein
MAELKDVDETSFGKPARQGHPSEMKGYMERYYENPLREIICKNVNYF